jgi:hypothetical protein
MACNEGDYDSHRDHDRHAQGPVLQTPQLPRAANLMWESDCGMLPVVDASLKLIGILSLNDGALAAGEGASVRDRDVVDALQGICAHHPRGTDQASA